MLRHSGKEPYAASCGESDPKKLNNPKSELSDDRKRDYRIYQSCVHTAFNNDLKNNREAKITDDELSILLTLSNELELSLEEVKLINYMVLPVSKIEIDTVINDLKSIGVLIYSKKNSTIYIADEMVRVLRLIREKEVADKFLRRILRSLKKRGLSLAFDLYEKEIALFSIFTFCFRYWFECLVARNSSNLLEVVPCFS